MSSNDAVVSTLSVEHVDAQDCVDRAFVPLFEWQWLMRAQLLFRHSYTIQVLMVALTGAWLIAAFFCFGALCYRPILGRALFGIAAQA